LPAIQAQVKLFQKAEKSRQRKQKAFETKLNGIRQSIKQFENTIQKLIVAKQDYYDSYKDEKITKDEFLFKRESCNKQIEEMTANIVELTEKLNNASSAAEQTTAVNSELQNCIGITELNREIVDALVDSIIVYDSENIEIKWKFADCYAVSP
jgi:chromosome segregation ATPase